MVLGTGSRQGLPRTYSEGRNASLQEYGTLSETLSEPLSECHYPLRVAGLVAPNGVAGCPLKLLQSAFACVCQRFACVCSNALAPSFVTPPKRASEIRDNLGVKETTQAIKV